MLRVLITVAHIASAFCIWCDVTSQNGTQKASCRGPCVKLEYVNRADGRWHVSRFCDRRGLCRKLRIQTGTCISDAEGSLARQLGLRDATACCCAATHLCNHAPAAQSPITPIIVTLLSSQFLTMLWSRTN